MTDRSGKEEQSHGGQAGNKGQHGKGQSNPGGFDQQSSSSMEKEQQQENRLRDLQKKRDGQGNDAKED